MKSKCWNYGSYSNSNYGTHSMAFTVGNITVYYSYETPIAFEKDGYLSIRENDWNMVTGKHLNMINRDKSIRISGDEFEKKLNKLLVIGG